MFRSLWHYCCWRCWLQNMQWLMAMVAMMVTMAMVKWSFINHLKSANPCTSSVVRISHTGEEGTFEKVLKNFCWQFFSLLPFPRQLISDICIWCRVGECDRQNINYWSNTTFWLIPTGTSYLIDMSQLVIDGGGMQVIQNIFLPEFKISQLWKNCEIVNC